MVITNLITNPSFEENLAGWLGAAAVTRTRVGTADTTTEVTTNMIANPSGETGTTGWVSSGPVAAVITASAEQALQGAQSFRLEASAAGRIGMQSSPNLTGITAGKPYTVSAYPRAATTGRQVYITINWFDAAGAFISGSGGPQVTDGLNWSTRMVHTATAPTGATQMRSTFFIVDAALGEVHYLDGVMVTQTPGPVAYFDGASANTATVVHAWTGTAHASTSTRTETVAGWSWRGGWSMRLQGSRAANGSLTHVILPGGVPGKTIGFRLTAKVISNPGGLRLMAQTVNAAGTIGSPYVALTPAPRDAGAFHGTGEWEWRGLYTPPADAQENIYLFFAAVNGGTADVYIDAALASFDLIDRNVSRPGEGLDVPPYGDGDDPEWEWEGGVTTQAHNARSIRKANKVNWTRNPSGEVDASLAATSAGPSATTYDPATRIVPARITSDLEAPHGAAVLEWQLVANAGGTAAVIFGDPANLAGTATPVSNQEITVFSGALRIMTALPAGAQAGPALVTYSATGQRQSVKGFVGDPPAVGWKTLLSAAMEEFPADTGVTSVPNIPPRWALGGFLLNGLTPGGTYTVRTDMGMFRRDHLGNDAASAGYYNYFDGNFTNAVWLGPAGLSASDLAIVAATPGDTTPPAVPTGLAATASSSRVTLTWTASPDADTAGYLVRRGGVVVADVAQPGYADNNVVTSATYSYTVSAYDTSGNASAQSTAVTATVPAPPPPPPGPFALTLEDRLGERVALHGGQLTVRDFRGPGGLATRSVVRARIAGHGSVNRTRWRDDRLITIDLQITGVTVDEAYVALEAVTRVLAGAVDTDRWLRWSFAGRDRQALVRVESIEPPVVIAGRILETQVTLRASDDRVYSQAVREIVVAGTALPNNLKPFNGGSVETGLLVYMDPPGGAALVGVTLEMAGRQLSFATLSSRAIVDTLARTVRRNNGNQYVGALLYPSRWPLLPPGSNRPDLNVGGTWPSGSQITVFTRDAYQ